MMPKGVNKVILIGHVGQAVELKYGPSGTAIANASLATSEKWKDKQSGDWKEKTEWHRLVAFGKTAEIMGEYVRKGTPIYVDGKLQTRKWQDKDGNDRYSTEIVVNDMQMLGGKPESQKRPDTQGGPPAQDGGGFDDEIPFMRLPSSYVL